MNKRILVMTAGVAALTAWQLGGCNLADLVRIPPITFELGAGLAEFEVQAGQAVRNSGSGAFDLSGFSIGSGSIELDPSVITVTPSGSPVGKGTANLQSGGILEITVWIAPADDVDTVCDTGEQYGPFSVTLDENNVPVSVDPSEVTLTQNTLDLLNSGSFSLCIEVISPVDGTVTINSLTFNFGL